MDIAITETIAPVTVLGVVLEHTGDRYGQRAWSNGGPLHIRANFDGSRWQITVHANRSIVASGMASTFAAAHAECEAQWDALCDLAVAHRSRGAL